MFSAFLLLYQTKELISSSNLRNMDLDYADEITTKRQTTLVPLPGITRRTLQLPESVETEEDLAKNATNYCCFWVYQNHPAISTEWKHRPEYPFDFVSNGQFVKNLHNHKD